MHLHSRFGRHRKRSLVVGGDCFGGPDFPCSVDGKYTVESDIPNAKYYIGEAYGRRCLIIEALTASGRSEYFLGLKTPGGGLNGAVLGQRYRLSIEARGSVSSRLHAIYTSGSDYSHKTGTNLYWRNVVQDSDTLTFDDFVCLIAGYGNTGSATDLCWKNIEIIPLELARPMICRRQLCLEFQAYRPHELRVTGGRVNG